LIPAGEDVAAAIAFYNKLGFQAIHQEGEPPYMAIVQRDEAEIFLVKNGDRSCAENTALRIYTHDIADLYAEVQGTDSTMIHPNDPLQIKPWGMQEFSIIDLAGVCITFYQPVSIESDLV
jgi:predicted enzyme related to lactoylglutathione lyase